MLGSGFMIVSGEYLRVSSVKLSPPSAEMVTDGRAGMRDLADTDLDPVHSLSRHSPQISILPHSPFGFHSLANRWASANWPGVNDSSK